MDFTSMGTKFQYGNWRQAYVIKLVTYSCRSWEVTKGKGISSLGLHGTVISTSHNDTSGDTMTASGDKMICSPTIQGTKLGSRLAFLGLGNQLSGVSLNECIADFIGCLAGW